MAQITKTGHVWLFEREKGAPMFPVQERRMPTLALDGERPSATQRFPRCRRPSRANRSPSDLTQRTPEARAALKTFE